MLLGGRCEILGLVEGESGPGFVARDGEELVCVVGHPTREVIAEAMTRNGSASAVIAMPENVLQVGEVLTGREAQPAVLHLLGEVERLPEAPRGAVRLLSGPEDLRHLPPGFRAELRAELGRVLSRGVSVAAAFVRDAPVSFCYVAAETESLWDVSIDTLAGHRRRGYAALCAAYLIEHMCEKGKRPVWGAVESNAPSLGLAAKLGFVPVDRVFVFEPA
jgi:GNAT superfamily N-acetyltransferase